MRPIQKLQKSAIDDARDHDTSADPDAASAPPGESACHAVLLSSGLLRRQRWRQYAAWRGGRLRVAAGRAATRDRPAC